MILKDSIEKRLSVLFKNKKLDILHSIDIKKLSHDDIGKWVVYEGHAGEKEIGRIKSWNWKYIFVVYKCDKNWHRFEEYTAAATDPTQLKLIEIKFPG